MSEATLPSGAGVAVVDVNWTRVYFGFAGMIIGQFMAMIDIQIVASSLTQIQSGISASADEIAWVQTIYLLAEVVAMPLTAYLTKMWGTRLFYVVAVVGFIITSAAVGFSSSVLSMIGFRALQGLFAGAMIPPVFATAMTIFPPEQRVAANVFVGLIVTLSGTIGPTLGGHITDLLSWRWLFFINIPVGMLVIFLVGRYANFDKGDPRLSKGIDWPGLGLMAVFLLSLQYVLEEGAGDRWFDNPTILWLSVLAGLAGAAFVWRQLSYWQPIVSLKPFADTNFALGAAMTFVTGISMFGGTFLLPLYLGRVRGYSSGEVGTTMLVTGLCMFLSAPLVGRIVGRVDARIALVSGFALSGWAMHLGVHITDNWGFTEFFLLQAVRGSSMMFAMVAAQQLSVATLPLTLMKDASGLLNLTRNVAGALALATLTTILGHQSAVHFMDLTSAASIANPVTGALKDGLTEMMAAGGMADPDGVARKAMSGMLHRQAAVLSFGDAFAALAVSSWVAAVLGLFARPGSAMARGDAQGGH